ncbi:BAG domain protein [Aspergillus ellipticus CBS 707.79]|uniref:BAG domain protein n=1 Tax=Aspergillus ellipticus CBS 707.79 TaxID=1448320 RepID=A0A319DI54_9EURO|nr:BAG domain protein [Aspergillus ellipticus CBS 707.79]
MSQLLSHSSLSSLGETCASYIDHVATNLPPSLHSLHHQIVTTLSSAKASPHLRFLTPWPDLVADHADSAYTAPVAYTLLACTVVFLAMSWRPFANLWRRSPSYTGVQNNPPHVTDNDFSYITNDDLANPSANAYRAQYAGAEDTEPDTLLLKHRKNTYELHFPAYAINDGALSVGQLRQRAAEVTRTPNPNRIKLLYKGKLLEADSLPCRSEGLKQQSEVLCVVSGVEPGDSSPSDVSEAEADKDSGLASRKEESSAKRASKKKRGGKKKKNQGKGPSAVDPNVLAPSAEPQRPSSAATGRGAMPPPSPPLGSFHTPVDKANGLMSYLRRELLPRCEEYLTNPPSDVKARDFEHKMLSEVILAQVILKADGIEPESEADRAARRALIKEAQKALNSLDQAAKI